MVVQEYELLRALKTKQEEEVYLIQFMVNVNVNVKLMQTQGVLARSPEPEAHDKAPDNNQIEQEFGNVGF